jgi:flavodoxin
MTVFMLSALLAFWGLPLAFPRAARGAEGPLVLYFTWSGHSRTLAEKIRDTLGGDLLEVEPEEAYPGNYRECEEKVAAELKRRARPAVKTDPEALAGRKQIVLVFPNWWNTVPPPVLTLLEKAQLADAVVYPVVTHGGGGAGHCAADLAAALKKRRAAASEALILHDTGGKGLGAALEKWLKAVKLI